MSIVRNVSRISVHRVCVPVNSLFSRTKHSKRTSGPPPTPLPRAPDYAWAHAILRSDEGHSDTARVKILDKAKLDTAAGWLEPLPRSRQLRLYRKARAGIEKYDEEMRAFIDSMTPEELAAENARREAHNLQKIIPDGPAHQPEAAPVYEGKKPTTSFILFSKAVRTDAKLSAEYGIDKHMPGGVGAKLLGEAWRKLSDAEKEPYVKMYAQQKEEYDAAHKAWKESLRRERQLES
ncbi:hypothetical protein SAICODRAFT_28314 [Saitoella complicata NRRL Y-17804]|uniref:uncharacterized protein n=1 Tax=Saitoella complicata (strain BCRC 22490 / CBS 7301 / JCM 7358 / NBRC 10748 / NRRL Y-17804) TaxID=698492 RepID=UPI000867A085|nr:uncharacterized protein SAICODRAFT_28314 [Saitoella complicata NRRL Y-17804]ODQ55984.1 hypothetical protein SAICODRAFT_28314 [Saitoella complicata NRRL Y-17804]